MGIIDLVGQCVGIQYLHNYTYSISCTDSEYRQALNLALLNLQESGVLREMKHKWWKEKHGGGACKVDRASNPISFHVGTYGTL